jgi:signal transduction histidine kinase
METDLSSEPDRKGPARVLSAVTVAAAGAAALFWLMTANGNGTAGAQELFLLMCAFALLLAIAGGYGWTMDRVWRRTQEAASDELTLFKDDFVARVSHELRSPLTGIVGAARSIDLDDLPDEDADAMRTIVARSAELSGIVDDLIIAARTDADLLAVDPLPVLVLAQVEEAVDFVRLLGADTTVECEDAVVLTDPERFRHVLRNLLVNAYRHGLPPLSVRGRVSGRHYVCQVVDRGPGVAAEVESAMFDRFVHTGSKDREPGSLGLGLAVAADLAFSMESEISYRRINGETHFVITIPLADRRRRPRHRRDASVELPRIGARTEHDQQEDPGGSV